MLAETVLDLRNEVAWWFETAARELVVVVHGHPEDVGPYTTGLSGHDD